MDHSTFMDLLAFKGTDANMCCRGVQFALDDGTEGTLYCHSGALEVCNSGFHFCPKLEDVDRHYAFSKSRVFIVRYGSNSIVNGDKCVTDELVFLREITRDTIQEVTCDPQFTELMAANMSGVVILCAARGETEAVRWLLDTANIDVHADNEAALMVASEGGYTDIVALLIERGAYVQANNNYALKTACFYGHQQTVALLLQSGADVHAGEDHLLLTASVNGNLSVVKVLLEHGAKIDARNGALRMAANYGHHDVVELLLERCK